MKRKALPCLALVLALVLGGLLGGLGIDATASAQSTPARALPTLPGHGSDPAVGAAATTPPTSTDQGVPTAKQLFDRVMRGVVAIERGGTPATVGTVLAGDGRILTALSGLGGSDGADVRYADGTTVHAKVGVSDRALDLALLVPASGRWTEGLGASDVDPLGVDLRAMLPDILPGGRAPLRPAMAGVKGQVDAHARSGQPLFHLLAVDVKGPPVAGAPLLDSTGSVVAILVRACKGRGSEAWSGGSSGPRPASGQAMRPQAPPTACVPIMLGAPVSAVRSFLSRTTSLAASSPATGGSAPWLGIRAETQESGNVHGVRVVAVAPSSPAEKADLRAGDVIVAADGHPLDSPKGLAETIAGLAVGDRVKLLVFSGGTFRDLAVELLPAP